MPKKEHVITQLQKANYYDIEGKSYQELKYKLAVIKETEVNYV
ncbi:hypothetical protein ACFQ4A_15850 [Lentibacillus salinarum]|uniref:Fur-regulated basic protein FbpA n=1 Tax=Lentibacillus salinarum TaxID=446820 RepID=A0ABW3ZY37_9BACI